MGVVRRVCTVTLAALPVAWPLTPAHADAAFQVQTTAAAVHVTVTQEPAASLITASLFDDAVAYAASDFDTSGSSEALAAPAFPGRLVVQGPDLLCSQLFSCPTKPPPYPFLADASYPRRTHDKAPASGEPMGSGPFVVTPLAAEAHAEADRNSGATEAGRVTLLAGTPGAVTIGASAAHSAVRSTAKGLTVTVRTTVSDIGIGDLVHIASVHAVDRIQVQVGHRPASHPSIEIGAVTVAGHSASIDQQGLHVDGNDGPALTQQVERSGVRIRTVGTHRSDTGNGARSDATALSVDVAIPVSGVPYVPNPLPALPPPFDQIPQLPGVNANGVYVGHVTLGAVGAAAGVGTEPTFDLGGVGSVPTAATGAGTSATPGSTAPPGGGELVRALAGAPAGSAPAVAPSSPPLLHGFADLLSKAAIENLYAVLALGTLALFIGWRGTVLLHRRRG